MTSTSKTTRKFFCAFKCGIFAIESVSEVSSLITMSNFKEMIHFKIQCQSQKAHCKLIKNCSKPWLRFTLMNGLGHSKIVFVGDFLFKSGTWNQICHRIHIFRSHRNSLNLTQQAFSNDQPSHIHLLTWFRLSCLKTCKPFLENTPVWLLTRNLSFWSTMQPKVWHVPFIWRWMQEMFWTPNLSKHQASKSNRLLRGWQSKKLHQIWVILLLALTNRVQFGYYWAFQLHLWERN